MASVPKQSGTGPMSHISSDSFQVLDRPVSENGETQFDIDFDHLHFDFDEETGTLTLEEAVSRLRELMKDNQELKECLLSSNNAFRDCSTLLSQSQRRCDTAENELKVRNEQSRTVFNTLSVALKSKTTEIKELKQNLERAQEGCVSEHVAEELQATIDKLREENKLLKEEVDHTQHGKEEKPLDVVSLQDELKTVNVTIREMKQKILELSEQKEDLLMGHEQDAAELEKSRQFADQMVEELKAKSCENERLTARIEELEESGKNLQESIDKVKEELNQKIEAHQKILAEKADLLSQNMNLNTELSQLQTKSINEMEDLPDLPVDGSSLVTVPRPAVEGSSHANESYQVVNSESATSRDSTQGQVDPSLNTRIQAEVSRGTPSTTEVKQVVAGRTAGQSQTEVKEAVFVVTTPGNVGDKKLQDRLKETEKSLEEKDKIIQELQARDSQRDEEARQMRDMYEDQLKQTKINYEKEAAVLRAQADKSSRQDSMQLVGLMNDVHQKEERAQKAEQQLVPLQACLKEKEQQLKDLQKVTTERQNEDERIIGEMTEAFARINTELNQYKHEYQVKFHENNVLRQSHNKIFSDYTKLGETFEEYKQEVMQKANHSVSVIKHKEALERIDNLTAQLLAAGESIEMKSEENQSLKSAVAKLQSDMEAYHIVNAQMEVYKADFQNERDARERMHEKCSQMEEDLNSLQRRNDYLQEELQKASDQQIREMQRRHGSYPVRVPTGAAPMHLQGPYPRVRPVSPAGQGDVAAGRIYSPPSYQGQLTSGFGTGSQSSDQSSETIQCPKCLTELPDYDTLHVHVIDCLDQGE